MRGESENCDIQRELLEKLFDEVKSANMIVLSGGEPFLCYEKIKELVEIMKAKCVQIPKVVIVTNGTIYDERIYGLLEENFEKISIQISMDTYHIESIENIYTSTTPSSDPRLHPRTQEEIIKNIDLHRSRGYFNGFMGAPKTLIDSGRAHNLDVPKEPIRMLGYFYSDFNNQVLVAGPRIYLDALGYITEGDTGYSSREELSIGNINGTSLSSMLQSNAIRIGDVTPDEFSKFLFDREIAYGKRQEEECIYTNNHITMVPVEKQMQ